LGLFLTGVLITEQPDLIKFILAAGGVGGAFALVRSFISRKAKQLARNLTRLADRLQETISMSSPSAVLESNQIPEPLDLLEQDEIITKTSDAERSSAAARKGTRA